MDKLNAHVDVIIIGGGPIGLACGIACRQSGLSHLIIEKGALVNSIYNYPLNMTFFSTSEKLEIGDVPFISHNPKPTRAEALEYYRRVTSHWRLNLALYERVLQVTKQEAGFQVITSKKDYSCKKLIIATGFYDEANLLGVSGEDLPKVHHYYKEAHPYFGQKIIVVGAANSAVDVAMETWRKGADVTMVVRGPNIRESVKYWIRPDIENRIREGSIKAYFNAQLHTIRDFEVEIETEEGRLTLANDSVLAMTGYLPAFDFLTAMGIEIGTDEFQTPIHDPETMMTTVDGIYLAGVICGGLKTNKWFIENSRIHAEQIVQHILRTGLIQAG